MAGSFHFGVLMLLLVLLLVSSQVTVHPHERSSHNHFDRDGRSHCGTHDLTPEQMQEDTARMNYWKRKRRRVEACVQCIEIDTYFHVINDSVGNGNVTFTSIRNQIQVLNSAFNGTAFYFKLRGVSRTTNDAWFSLSDPRTKEGASLEREMKRKLRQGASTALNIYSNGVKCCLGYASSPLSFSDSIYDDGVVILHTVLPGGANTAFNLGFTAVHEVGHWLGLLHVFSGGCEGPGDLVRDTAPQRYPTYGCVPQKDSCSSHRGMDNIHNFMDYSDDSCMSQFTTGQAERMLDQFYIYRQQNEDCGPREALIDFEITVDSNFEETSWKLVDTAGNSFLESEYNLDSGVVHVDICVPVGLYTFVIADEGGDGICCRAGKGNYRIAVNGVVVKEGGTFGHKEMTKINVTQAPAPGSMAPSTTKPSSPTPTHGLSTRPPLPTVSPTIFVTSRPTTATHDHVIPDGDSQNMPSRAPILFSQPPDPSVAADSSEQFISTASTAVPFTDPPSTTTAQSAVDSSESKPWISVLLISLGGFGLIFIFSRS